MHKITDNTADLTNSSLEGIKEKMAGNKSTGIPISFNNSDIVKRIQFLELMEGTYKNNEYGSLFFKGKSAQTAIVFIRNLNAYETKNTIHKIRNYFPKEHCHLIPYKNFIFALFEDTPDSIIKRLLEKLHDYFEKSGIEPILTLGRCFPENKEPGSGIRQACLDAEKLLEQFFFNDEKKYLSWDELNEFEKKPSKNTMNIQKEAFELCSYIQVTDHEKIRDFMKKLRENLIYSGKNANEIRLDCMMIIIESQNCMTAKFPALKEIKKNCRKTLGDIIEAPCLNKIMEIMINDSINTSEMLPLLSADNNFQRILSYVKNNYYEDLKLEDLGRLFNYNCAYLGKLFKEYTGKTFHTYMDILRVDAAKELLHNSNMKVYEISSAIGYANTDYFYGKFKKYTGKSPLVFRKK